MSGVVGMKALQCIFLSLTLCILAGCASGANSQNMTASIKPSLSASPSSAFYQSMVIEKVSGGKDTNPIWTSQVSNEDFQHALKSSLHQHHLYAGGPAKYTVSAEIAALDQPIMGVDMSVSSKVRYKVTRNSDKAVIFNEVIATTYTAKFGDSLIGMERLRLANEGSIRQNIGTFISKLSNTSA